MDDLEFRTDLETWLDGELPPDRAAAMQAFADASPEHAALAAAHRAWNERVRAALVADVDARATVAGILAATRPRARVQPPRRLALVRPFAAAAAVLMMATSLAWFYCVGPFECAYLEALERAVEAPVEVDPDRVADLVGQLGAGIPHPTTPCEGPSAVRVAHGGDHMALRYCYELPSGSAVALWCDAGADRPSFRRRVVKYGRTWWITELDGRSVVAFLDCTGTRLCCLVGEQSPEELMQAAGGILDQ